jgi:methionyl-tRNA formyltransferase
VTYAHKITKDEARLNWTLGTHQLDCKIRAFNPYPGASFDKEGLLIKAWRAEPLINNIHNKSPGEIISVDKLGVVVATGDGALMLTELQKPGGKKISAGQLAHSLLWAPGQRLG